MRQYSNINRRDVLATGLAASTLFPSSAVAAKTEEHPVALTSHGPVRGYIRDNVKTFKGVRYGADTSERRFQKPVAPIPWQDPVDSFDYGAASPQRGDREAMGEDCLFLNVWTPALADGGARPVIVYFHGGAYNSGSGSHSLYDGVNLVNKGDVVVITVNHRLNAFGYLYLPMLTGGAFPDSGNAGIWDLVLALGWVRDNAAAFGGDPSRVMVFGQSGGGAKIATMMAAPAARGLFHSAATMSGQQVTASGPLNATERARAFLDAASIEYDDVESLKTAPAEKMIEALSAVDPINSERGLYFGPVLDERFLTQHPFWPEAPAQSASIPMILGNTKDETRNLIGNREPDTFDLTWDEVPARLARHMRVDISPIEVLETYRRVYPDYSPSDVFFAATTAGRSWRGQVEESDARARQVAPTWVYQMNLPSPLDGGKWGAPHTFDIPLAFDNMEKEGSMTGTGRSARRVADQLSKAFINLARNGDPNHDSIPQWGKHNLPARETMVFDEETQLVSDPRKEERELFAKVPFIQWGT
ncbi:carboxylesterase/lipase family protein [Hyphococcus flavus]|uniref:Carboxylic ester hydrolase n=1 Tax=Hyphococcus flavus TaxID=1866326 RepID=A0AAF0CEU0_9PROT|nr:carboxylesterase/lipase family protein [Hyphococcus flavus]WDI30088.1 carboxylesterase/lipase family protein [Hyphococcus flavus]